MRKLLVVSIVIFSLFTNQAHAELWGGCDYHSKHPCPTITSENAPEGTALASGHCRMLEINDKGCWNTQYMYPTYLALAATCIAACFTAVAALGVMCTYGSTVASLADLSWSIVTKAQTEKEITAGSKQLEKDWGLGAQLGFPIAGFLLHGGVIAARFVGTDASKSFMSSWGWDKAGKSSTNEGWGACFSAGINALMAGMKFYHHNTITNNSKKTYEDMCTFTNCETPLAETPPQQAPNSPTAPTAGSSTSPGAMADVRGQSFTEDVGSAIDEAAKNGTMAENAANGELKNFLGNPKPKDIQKVLNDLPKLTGMTPRQLAEAAAQNGVANTLGKFTPDTAEGKFMKDLLKNSEDEMQKWLKNHPNPIQFAGAASGGGRSSGSTSSPFSGLLGGRSPGVEGGQGPQEVKFGGFTNDIWHAGTNKSIFEIINDKTHNVTDRVQK